MNDRIRTNVKYVGVSLICLLIVLILYVTYIQIYKGSFWAGHALNRRTDEISKTIKRGSILDRNGNKLAISRYTDGRYQRIYPYEDLTAHIVGYDNEKFGRTGAEAVFNGFLSGSHTFFASFGPAARLFSKAGYNVHLTLDINLQQAAYKALGNKKGAAIVMNPGTGEILAMVSKPSFEPDFDENDWKHYIQDKSSPLLNRALNGLYPPGSIIKVMVAETALKEKTVSADAVFKCSGSLKIGDYILNEADKKAHGTLSLSEALAESCNVTFAQLALKLGNDKINNAFERYGFYKYLTGELEESKSILPNVNKLSSGELAQTAIGQGELLVTPIKMALLASAFANDGVVMKPYFMKDIITEDGSVIEHNKPTAWFTAAGPDSVRQVAKMMRMVVEEGTGQAAEVSGIKVAGKTGTAENPHGAPHAWFIGYAPFDNPQVAVAVIIENGGAGGKIAAPIARQIIMEALR